MTTKTTAGAVRCAEKILRNGYPAGREAAKQTIATIIDNEFAELVEAAQGAFDLLCSLRAEQIAPKTLAQLEAALAKAGK